jgi:hypothetical protein
LGRVVKMANAKKQRSGIREQGSENREGAKAGSASAPVVAKAKRKWRGNGAARVKKAADQMVAENSEELANLLLKDALEGKMESARLLVSLSEKTMRPPARARRGQSWADKLAAEPEWDAERDGGLTAEDLPGSEENWKQECAGAFEKETRGIA